MIQAVSLIRLRLFLSASSQCAKRFEQASTPRIEMTFSKVIKLIRNQERCDISLLRHRLSRYVLACRIPGVQDMREEREIERDLLPVIPGWLLA